MASFARYCKVSKSIMTCLESKEYMEVRNALHVLTRVIDVFPVMKKLSEMIEKRVDKLRQDERKDLQIMASQYFTMLQKLKPSMEAQEDFTRGVAIEGGSRGGGAKGGDNGGGGGSGGGGGDAKGKDGDRESGKSSVKGSREGGSDSERKRPAPSGGGEPPPKAVRTVAGVVVGASKPANDSPLNPNAKPFQPTTGGAPLSAKVPNGDGGGDRSGGGGGGAATAAAAAAVERKRDREGEMKSELSGRLDSSPGPPPKTARDDRRDDRRDD